MIKIGDFSKIANVTVKTLHHYGEIGILKPARVDRYSGYRYYTLDQLPRINRILALKDLGFSLDQIADILNQDLSIAELRGMLRLKQAELTKHIDTEKARLRRVEYRLHQLERHGHMPRNEIAIKSVDAQTVLCACDVATTREQIQPLRLHLRDTLEAYLQDHHIRPESPWFALVDEQEYTERDLLVEMAIGIRSRSTVTRLGHGKITLKKLPKVKHMACIVQPTQQAEGINQAYRALLTWVMSHGYHASGAYREIFLSERENPDLLGDYIELQCPVERTPYPLSIQASGTQREDQKMEPKIITKPEFYVVGMAYVGKNEHNEVPQLWDQFNNRVKEVEYPEGVPCYGLCNSEIEGAGKGEFEYVAGVEVDSPEAKVPNGMVMRHIPARKYAVFTHHGKLNKLGETYAYIYDTWLPQSGLKLDSMFDMELYNDDFILDSDESKLYIYVAVK
jgi:predicted transcriptional regulator YdeE/DNA-binding transcriptional MerR regulator